MIQWQQFFIAQEALLLVHLKNGHYLWSKYRFKLSPPNENVTELFSVIVRGDEKPRAVVLRDIWFWVQMSSKFPNISNVYPHSVYPHQTLWFFMILLSAY